MPIHQLAPSDLVALLVGALLLYDLRTDATSLFETAFRFFFKDLEQGRLISGAAWATKRHVQLCLSAILIVIFDQNFHAQPDYFSFGGASNVGTLLVFAVAGLLVPISTVLMIASMSKQRTAALVALTFSTIFWAIYAYTMIVYVRDATYIDWARYYLSMSAIYGTFLSATAIVLGVLSGGFVTVIRMVILAVARRPSKAST